MYSKTLPKAYAVALLREDFGLTFEEIGERMGCSNGAARYLYYLLLARERKTKTKSIQLWQN